jgi:hypothetical protein
VQSRNPNNPGIMSEKHLKVFENFAQHFPEKDLTLDTFNIPMNAISLLARLRAFFLIFSKNSVWLLRFLCADGQKSRVYASSFVT